ncbi:polyprenol reductase [Anopheles maculipalpis]|uniref:polyprenol reductase n=1 Tax=Anopheles maculipalpis TaxID=1496333 RepID=UPI002158B0C5|nr:polyprenol reductase [Anopheles maculipalpis]
MIPWFDIRSINLINFLFVNLIVTVVVLGGLLATIEKHLPTVIRQTFRYGKHALKGTPDRLVSLLEVPKAWFKHFYIFAALWALAGFGVMMETYITGKPAPDYVIAFLDTMATNRRMVRTTPTETLIAMTLITLQCLRRFYETWFVQVFSSKLKINLSAYLVGYIHYFGTIVAILSQAEGFTRSGPVTLPTNGYRFELSVPFGLAILVFYYAWYHQYRSNVILANLRKDKTGKVVSQKHSLPRGDYFEVISSPHMFFEIVMYAVLFAVLYRNSSMVYVMLWVASNQLLNSWLTHQWYVENFPNYPKQRKALIPYVL